METKTFAERRLAVLPGARTGLIFTTCRFVAMNKKPLLHTHAKNQSCLRFNPMRAARVQAPVRNANQLGYFVFLLLY